MSHTLRIELDQIRDADAIAFLETIRPLYGSRATSLVRALRAVPAFVEWRRKVEYCGVCRRFVLIRRNPARPGGVIFVQHDRVTIRHGIEYTAPCPTGDRETAWRGDRYDYPPDIVNAQLRHLVSQIGPDLL